MIETKFGLEITLGAVFVVINAYERFNTPSAHRFTTTVVRYYSAAFIYVALACITFLVLSHYPALLKQIVGEEIPDAIAQLPAPLMVALVLTVLLDKIPIFAVPDRWLRQQLQYVANIPYEARRLSHHLQRDNFTVTEPMRHKIRQQLLSTGFREDDIQFERNESPQYLWTKITVLFDHLADWEGRRKFSGFMTEFADEVHRLRQRHAALAQKAKWYLAHSRELPADRADARSLEVAEAYRSYFRGQTEELFAELCNVLSRGILQCSVVHDKRREALRELGFSGDEAIACSRLSFHQLATLFGVSATVLLFGLLLASKQASEAFGHQLAIVLMVATIYCLAIVCALYPKDHWAIARRGAHGERPAAFYLIAGLLAAGSSIVVNFMFKIVLLGWSKALVDLTVSHPWALCSFFTAVSIAYLADNHGDEYGSRQRWVEGELQAASMMVTSYLTHLWLMSSGYYEFRQRDPQQFLPYLILLGAVNGFTLGYLVPTWYRRSCQRIAKDSESPAQTSAPAVAAVVAPSH